MRRGLLGGVVLLSVQEQTTGGRERCMGGGGCTETCEQVCRWEVLQLSWLQGRTRLGQEGMSRRQTAARVILGKETSTLQTLCLLCRGGQGGRATYPTETDEEEGSMVYRWIKETG